MLLVLVSNGAQVEQQRKVKALQDAAARDAERVRKSEHRQRMIAENLARDHEAAQRKLAAQLQATHAAGKEAARRGKRSSTAIMSRWGAYLSSAVACVAERSYGLIAQLSQPL